MTVLSVTLFYFWEQLLPMRGRLSTAMVFSDLQLRAAAAAAALRPELDGTGSQASKDAAFEWVMMWDWKSDGSRDDHHRRRRTQAKKDWKKIIGEARACGFCEPELADSPQRLPSMHRRSA